MEGTSKKHKKEDNHVVEENVDITKILQNYKKIIIDDWENLNVHSHSDINAFLDKHEGGLINMGGFFIRGLRVTPVGPVSSLDLNYKKQRQNNVSVVAMSWEQVVWEASQAIGEEDTQTWLKGMCDILDNKFFIRDPVPFAFAANDRARNNFPHVIGHTWVTPHPEAWQKLGYYQVWRPEGMEEVFGEDKVRSALMENYQ